MRPKLTVFLMAMVLGPPVSLETTAAQDETAMTDSGAPRLLRRQRVEVHDAQAKTAAL